MFGVKTAPYVPCNPCTKTSKEMDKHCPNASKLCPATGRMASSACAKFGRPAPTPWTRYGGDGRRRRRRTHNLKFNK